MTYTPESPLAKFIDECKGTYTIHILPNAKIEILCPSIDESPLERAKTLETTDLFADIHSSAAASGQTAPPSADTRVDLHFTCFVQAPSPPSREEGAPVTPGGMRLLELDGRRNGPIDRGACTDFLKVSDALHLLSEQKH